MKPLGLPFLLILSFTIAGPPVLCGLPLVLLLCADDDRPPVASPALPRTAPRPAVRRGGTWRRRGLVQRCTTRATVPASTPAACVSQEK